MSDTARDKVSSMLLQFMFLQQGGRVVVHLSLTLQYHSIEKGHNWNLVHEAGGREVTMKQRLYGVMFLVLSITHF